MTHLKSIGALAMAALALAIAPASAQSLDFVSRTQITENNQRAKISVFPGKAGYESTNVTPTNSGTFGDGTVTDYYFIRSDGNNVLKYADGGAGLIDTTATGPGFVSGTQNWAQLWDLTDPGDPLFSTAPDLDPAGWSGGADVTGTIDISGLSGAGSIYFMHGTFINQWSITVTMIDNDAILPDIVASDAQTANGPGTNFGWISEFKFCDAAEYETISFYYFNADRDGSRARFMGTIIDEDTSPPAIVSQVPEHDSTTVFAGSNIEFTFDEDFDTTTGNITLVDLDNTTSTIISIDDTAQVSIVGRTIIVDPTVDLLFETNYAVQIDAGIIFDCASPPNSFAGIIDTTTWNFTTLPVDTTAPVITALSPDVDTTVRPDVDLVATFDEAVQAVSGLITLRNLTGSIDTTIDILDTSQVSFDGNQLIIQPTGGLDGGNQYAIQIQSGAIENLSGFAFTGITDDTTWRFDTIGVTTMTASSNWLGGIWDNGDPGLGMDAIIDTFVTATAANSVNPWSGVLTLRANSLLNITAGSNPNPPDMAFDGATQFVLEDGAIIRDNFKTTTFNQDWVITGTAGLDSNSNAGNNHNRIFNGTISGGIWTTGGRNHQGYTYNSANTFDSYVVDADDRHGIAFNAPGAAGNGDVTVNAAGNERSGVLILGAGDVFSTTCVLTLNGKGWNGSTGGFGPYASGPWVGTSVRIAMGSNNSTVRQLFIDGIEQPAGDYTGADADWIDGTGILTVLTGAADTTPPTVVSIVDDVSGTIFEGSTVTYTVTFSEPIDAATVDVSDFEDGGTSAATIGSVSATGDPAVFTVVATPTVAGDLILQVAMGAVIEDLFENALDTSSAIPDDTTIPVSPAPDLMGELGILSVVANGGINPNTGALWQAGDQYRLAFYTQGTIDAQSDDPAVYDAFATAQAAAAGLGGSWTAMVWVNTDDTLPQGTSPVSSPVVRSGTDDQTGGAGIGGAGVPVYAMDGKTCIARNNADIYNNWSNPFDGDAVIRIPAGTGAATQNVHYSPFLDQFGGGDSGNVHGANVWTGGFSSAVNPLGNSVDPDAQVRASWGSSNANNAGRVWNRFQSATTSSLSVYAISGVLTVSSGAADPLILKIAENGGNLDFEWNSLPGMQYDLLSSTTLDPGATTWAIYNDGTMTYEDIPASGLSTTLTGVLKVGPERFFAVREEEAPPLFEEDFEADNGNFDTTTTVGSSWEHGTPNSSSAGGAVTEGNGGSTNCWGTLLATNNGQYADSTVTLLRSPVIDLTGIAAAELCFAEALDLEAGDTAVVNIIDDTTDAVIAAAIYTATDPSNSDADWATANGGTPITIPAPALGQPIRIEWSFTGFGGATDDYLGWYIDDVSVVEVVP